MSDSSLEALLKPGDRVDLEVLVDLPKDDTEEERKFYITKIYDIRDEDHVEILMPMDKTKLLLLPVDSEYQVFFYAEKGIFTCEARVEERYRDNQFAIAVLELTTELKKQQRREYYRYSCVIGMNARQLTEEEEQTYLATKETLLFDDPVSKSVIVDISGGGMRFVTEEKFEKGKMIYCKFSLKVRDQYKNYSCVVKILDERPVGNQTKNVEYRAEFMYMDDQIRESIIRFIFEDERKMLRKM